MSEVHCSGMSEEQQEAFAQLDDCEQRFAMAILQGANGSAALRVGWPGEHPNAGGRTAGMIRNRPRVHAFLTAMQATDMHDVIMSRNEAMERLTRIARTTLADVIDTKQVNWGTEEQPDYQIMWNLRLDNEEALEAVSEVKAGPNGPQVKMHDPLKAIKQMADMSGWNAAVELDVNAKGITGATIDVEALSTEALHEIVMIDYEATQAD